MASTVRLPSLSFVSSLLRKSGYKKVTIGKQDERETYESYTARAQRFRLFAIASSSRSCSSDLALRAILACLVEHSAIGVYYRGERSSTL